MDGVHLAVSILTVVLVLSLFERIQDRRERRDLYTRLMARDLTDYRAASPGQTRNFLKKALERSRITAEAASAEEDTPDIR